MTHSHDQTDARVPYDADVPDLEPAPELEPAGEFDHIEPLDWSDVDFDATTVNHIFFGDDQLDASSEFASSSIPELNVALASQPWEVAASALPISDPSRRLEPEDLVSPQPEDFYPEPLAEAGTEPDVLAATLALSDDALERVVQEWTRIFDIAGAFTRAHDTAPTSVDRRHLELTADSRCTGGVAFLDGSATRVVHPRITWRYCADPAALLVLAQPIPSSDKKFQLQLWSGSGWTPLTERADGYLAAQTRPRDGGQITFRLVRRPQ